MIKPKKHSKTENDFVAEYDRIQAVIRNLESHFVNNSHLTKEMFEAILEADE